ncbi:tripartite tricarboxylate transporter substrate binding protein [Bordetella sp. BOR01]|uniref:Bug family tripartite tricarboxylate transporter substrate binding protein n=1 Tax=Bordetella sp. BOR01 TaxID=2854779 RepID=UPI001C436AF0|nr:tripartite tricarboxylate transporter substrate binding protein [Bordetella sp. BOR01]MBV7484862.1 tripartite tricarboxylate transporter substrate binding protein [Bordetella sp. BOR01]
MQYPFRRFLLCTVLALLSGLAWAGYPERPVKLVLPLPAGSATDVVARILAAALSESVGQSIVVENRPGADGAIAGAYVAKATADGYTLLFGTNSPMAAAPAMHKAPPYDPARDFTPISLVGRYSSFLWVNDSLPFRSLGQVLDYARANPGKLTYATGNTGGMVAMAQMLSLAGKVKMTHVPYKGEPAALIDVVSNRVQLMFATPSAAQGYAREGKLRALVTTLSERSPGAPDVPTMAEAGLPDFSITLWAGIYGPSGVPEEIVTRLSNEINRALGREDVRRQLMAQQFFPEASTSQGLAEFTRAQLASYAQTLREAGFQPE